MPSVLKIGAHLTTTGGLDKAVIRAEEMGLNCLQFFGASPRQWRVKEQDPENIEKFKEARKSSGLLEVYLHAAYLVNLASPDPETAAKSEENLAAHFKIAQKLEANGLIFHIGSGGELPRPEAIKRVVSGIKRILDKISGPAKIILENSAGGGQKLGSFPEEIKEILEGINSKRAAVCIDTAHALESGLIMDYTEKAVEGLMKRWERSVGWANTPVIHANDSKTAPDSHHDQHANIGKGYIGMAGFKNMAKVKALADKAWIMEVPGFDGNGPDKKNADLLKSCFKH
ncbi:MAG: deoxyribonuclease IV [Patescibacteria group bacterium]|nr:deoxyribonuclease IV [Patescibacteria group bacterium]MDE2144385.1 deoxyribonuclease IV [Patescibacteria group bacterium]